MNILLGNRRNEKGLCATPDCAGEAVHSFVYKYCDRCFAAITEALESGCAPNVGLLERADAIANIDALQQSASS